MLLHPGVLQNLFRTGTLPWILREMKIPVPVMCCIPQCNVAFPSLCLGCVVGGNVRLRWHFLKARLCAAALDAFSCPSIDM